MRRYFGADLGLLPRSALVGHERWMCAASFILDSTRPVRPNRVERPRSPNMATAPRMMAESRAMALCDPSCLHRDHRHVDGWVCVAERTAETCEGLLAAHDPEQVFPLTPAGALAARKMPAQ